MGNFGDENSKLFHAHATIRHRRNQISSLLDVSGNAVFDHDLKANLIWNDFKIRISSGGSSVMQFDLDSLWSVNLDLSSLELPFTHEEVDNVVRCLPLDKSLGPDDFNNEFLKKCWNIVKHDFYNLCEAFHSGDLCL